MQGEVKDIGEKKKKNLESTFGMEKAFEWVAWDSHLLFRWYKLGPGHINSEDLEIQGTLRYISEGFPLCKSQEC